MKVFFLLALSPFLYFVIETQCGIAETYSIDGDIVGQVSSYRVQKGDTLHSVARNSGLGIVELMAANPGIDPWMPKIGSVLRLPTSFILPENPRDGIVINLSELRLFYFPSSRVVMTFPIGIGKKGWSTPTGLTLVVKKREAPVWIPPNSIVNEQPWLPEMVPPGANNPLGSHAINLGFDGYIIHGTNRPYGVGRRSSHGCIRLYPEDISELFEHVELGTKVRIEDKVYKLGWFGKELWLEVTPNQLQADEIIETGASRSRESLRGLNLAIIQATKAPTHIDWQAVDKVRKAHSSTPTIIGWRE